VEQIGTVQGTGIDRSLNVWCLLFYEHDNVVHKVRLIYNGAPNPLVNIGSETC